LAAFFFEFREYYFVVFFYFCDIRLNYWVHCTEHSRERERIVRTESRNL